MDQQDQVADKVRARIIEAAEALYLEAGHEKLPTVDAVRRRAGCDMNSASLVVRDWKRQLTVKAEPVATVVPDAVMQVFMDVLGSAWGVAQDLANASLRTAQTAWERERDEQESMRAELSDLWEKVAQELTEANERNADLLRAQEKAAADELTLQEIIGALRADLADQKARADQAEARVAEIEHRVADLKSELALAHNETKAVRAELTEARSTHLSEMNQLKNVSAGEIETARSELATYKGKTEEAINARDRQLESLQRDLTTANGVAQQAQSDLNALNAETKALEKVAQEQRKSSAAEAHRQAERFTKLQAERDEAVRGTAHLAGQLEAVQQQCADLMTRFKN